jgi:hypothetical protein
MSTCLAWRSRWSWARALAVAGHVAWVGLAGCAPSLNWREVAVPGPGLAALFPCRPVGLARAVPLAGRTVTLSLQSCEADGGTYAVASGDVGEPASVAAVLRALREATTRNLAAGTDIRAEPWTLAGVTPQADAGRWRLGGKRPDGQPVRADTAVFSRGTWVVQATVIGPSLGEAMTQPFFEGLRFTP